MEQIQDSRHCKSDEITPENFKALRQGDFCNKVHSAAQSRSIDHGLRNSKSTRLLNIGIRGTSSAAYTIA
jgi:hypothetical protein